MHLPNEISFNQLSAIEWEAFVEGFATANKSPRRELKKIIEQDYRSTGSQRSFDSVAVMVSRQAGFFAKLNDTKDLAQLYRDPLFAQLALAADGTPPAMIKIAVRTLCSSIQQPIRVKNDPPVKAALAEVGTLSALNQSPIFAELARFLEYVELFRRHRSGLLMYRNNPRVVLAGLNGSPQHTLIVTTKDEPADLETLQHAGSRLLILPTAGENIHRSAAPALQAAIAAMNIYGRNSPRIVATDDKAKAILKAALESDRSSNLCAISTEAISVQALSQPFQKIGNGRNRTASPKPF